MEGLKNANVNELQQMKKSIKSLFIAIFPNLITAC